MAKYVEQALDDGYSITFIGLLAWYIILKAIQYAVARTLFYVFEAFFTFAF
jgi:hypothetical protein